MKTFISALLIAASPLCARAQYSADISVRQVQGIEKGNPALVREYDGGKAANTLGDIAVSAAGKAAVAEAAVTGINSRGQEDAWFKLNYGEGFALTGSFSSLYHRQPFLDYRTLMNGLSVSPLRTEQLTPTAQSAAGLTDLTNGELTGFKRRESEIKAVVYGNKGDGGHALVSFWQEDERGSTPARYPGAAASLVSVGATADQVYPADLDRLTRELTYGLGVGVGDGAVAGDYSHRTFNDSSGIVVTSAAYTGLPIQVARPEFSPVKSDSVDLRFRGSLMEGLPVTGLLSARIRTNAFNKFTSKAYTASLAGAYSLTRKARLNMRLYSRAYGVKEDMGFANKDYGSTSGVTPTSNFGDGIDRYNLSGELKGRYDYSERLGFSAGYKYENNYRRHAAHYTEEFAGNALYTDGTYISSYTQVNAVSVREERHIFSAGFSALLPLEIALDAGYTGSIADKAAFESLPTNTHAVDSGLSVPLPYNLAFNANIGYASEQNLKSSHSDSKMEQNTYQGGLDWQACSAFSMGADYSYDRASYRNTGWFGTQNNPTGTIQLAALMRRPNMLYRFENRVLGYHATAKLPYGFSLTGGGSYTVSLGKTPVYLDQFAFNNANAPGVVVTDLTPSDTRMASGRVVLNYDYADWLGAALGYRRDDWHDMIVSANSGRYSYVDLSLTAKF